VDLPFRQVRGGVGIRVRLTPRSSSDRIEGVRAAADGEVHLAARVRAVPEKGAANAALERLVARWLDLPAGSVAVTAGGTARLKMVMLAGDPAALSLRIAERLARD
jgi:uncharacterized protein YggU (UPF0235/DUF167 family)